MGSSPVADTGRALSELGYDVTGRSAIDEVPPRHWRAFCQECDVLIFIRYHGGGPQIRRQLLIARDEGLLIARLWAGSDAYYAANQPIDRLSASRLDPIVDINIAASSVVKRRLSMIGINSVVVPPRADVVTDPGIAEEPLPPAVLAYLPNGRTDFYGASYVRRAAEALPSVPFLVVGDDAHTLGDLPNVESLGFVDDMDPVWERTGCLLRITEHDSAPRMIETALSRGCYVIFNKPHDGCWLARSEDQVVHAVGRFSTCTERNPERPVYSEAHKFRHGTQLIEILSEAQTAKAPTGDQRLQILALEMQRAMEMPIRYFRWRLARFRKVQAAPLGRPRPNIGPPG